MRFNGRVAAIAAGISAAAYLMLPTIQESRADQLITFAALYYIAALGCAWAAEELTQISRKRDSLGIIGKRRQRGNRDTLKTDIKLKKKSWVISIPAEKVTD